MKKKFVDVLIILILVVIAFLICMKSPTNIFQKSQLSYTDSSVFKYIGLSMTNGQVPYRDMFDHKGVLLYFINYIGTLISTNFGVWIIEFIGMFISLLFAYKIARKFTSKPISLLITCIVFSQMYVYFEGGNLTEEYALTFQMIALYIFIDFFKNSKNYLNSDVKKKESLIRLDYKLFNIPVFICGICCACVLFLRANMISVWLVFVIMVLVYCIVKKKYFEIVKFAISFLSGMLIIAIPLLIYLLKNGAFQAFIDDYVLFNMKYSSISTKMNKIDAFTTFLNTQVTSLAFIIIMMKLYTQIKNKEPWQFNFGYLCYMLVTLILISMPGRHYGHYGMTMLPTLIYPYCILYQFLQDKNSRNKALSLVVSGYLLWTIVAPVTLNFSKDCLTSISNRNNLNSTINVTNYIRNNTDYNDTISVFGNDCNYYYLSNRKSASKFFYQTPIEIINTEFANEYFEDLKKNKPKLILMTQVDFDANFTQKMYQFLEENNYELVVDGKVPIYEIKGEE